MNPIFIFATSYFFLTTISCTGYLYKDFADYRRVFKSLKDRKFIKVDENVFMGVLTNDNTDLFVWYSDGNHFILGKSSLINHLVTCFCPYSFYWLIKYQIWCRKNVKKRVSFTLEK